MTRTVAARHGPALHVSSKCVYIRIHTHTHTHAHRHTHMHSQECRRHDQANEAKPHKYCHRKVTDARPDYLCLILSFKDIKVQFAQLIWHLQSSATFQSTVQTMVDSCTLWNGDSEVFWERANTAQKRGAGEGYEYSPPHLLLPPGLGPTPTGSSGTPRASTQHLTSSVHTSHVSRDAGQNVNRKHFGFEMQLKRNSRNRKAVKK